MPSKLTGALSPVMHYCALTSEYFLQATRGSTVSLTSSQKQPVIDSNAKEKNASPN